MRPLDGNAANYPGFAREASLAYLRVPALGSDYGREAAEMLQDAWNRPLLAHIYGRDMSDANRILVDLVDAEIGASMAESLVASGLARVARTEASRVRRRAGVASRPSLMPSAAEEAAAATDREFAHILKLEAAQLQAKENREGMWQYGDVGDSDLEDKPRGGGGTRGGRGGGRGGSWAAAANRGRG